VMINGTRGKLCIVIIAIAMDGSIGRLLSFLITETKELDIQISLISLSLYTIFTSISYNIQHIPWMRMTYYNHSKWNGL
jgi:hypothetical protein